MNKAVNVFPDGTPPPGPGPHHKVTQQWSLMQPICIQTRIFVTARNRGRGVLMERTMSEKLFMTKICHSGPTWNLNEGIHFDLNSEQCCLNAQVSKRRAYIRSLLRTWITPRWQVYFMSLCNYRGGAVRGMWQLTHIRGPCVVIRCDGSLNNMHMGTAKTSIHRGKAVWLQSIINQLYWSRTDDWLTGALKMWKWHHLLCFWLSLQPPFILHFALIHPQSGSTSMWHRRLGAQWPDIFFLASGCWK